MYRTGWFNYLVVNVQVYNKAAAHQETVAKTAPLRIIGVDDFAFRRGARYGTLIVDLERHKVMDLLPDSTSATFEEWLHHHSQIEVISRDRASAYAEAARKAAPNALQVADRFHLSKNLHEVTERIVKRYYTTISRILALPPQVEPTDQNAPSSSLMEDQSLASPATPFKPTGVGEVSSVGVDPATLSWKERRRQENIERKLQLYEQVKQLHERGLSRKEIAQKLNLDYGTVGRYLKGAAVVGARVLRHSKLDPYKPYIMQRYLQEHCDNAQQLWREITAQGYEGGVSGVSTFVAQLRFEQNGLELGGKPLTKKLRPLALSLPSRVKAKAGVVVPTVRQLSWYLFLPATRLQELALSQLKTILEAQETLGRAYALIQSFNKMMSERKADKLSEWLEQLEVSGIEELKSFGGGIKRDEAAVRAGLIERWSQGVVEGKVNKVKLIKRQLYGRANFDLLRTMVLGAEAA